MASRSNDVPAAAAAPFSLLWGESPALYLSYGTAALKGTRPALTDAVAAAASFTALSPPMGLDYFAVFDARRLGAAVAEHLPAKLAGAIAEKVEDELVIEDPRFLAAPHDGVGWWRTVIREAFRAVLEEVAGGERAGGAGEDALVGETAVVALVTEKHIVVASSGGCKAVLCRGGGEHVELTPERRANNADVGALDLNSEPHESFVIETTLTSGMGVIDLNSEPPASDMGVIDLNSEPPASGSGGSTVVIPELDVMVVERQGQDEFLILASGGLWGAVAPASACAFVRQRLGVTSRITMQWETPVDARGSPDMLARELANKAVHAGSKDNVSVAIVMFRDFWAKKDGEDASSSAPAI